MRMLPLQMNTKKQMSCLNMKKKEHLFKELNRIENPPDRIKPQSWARLAISKYSDKSESII